MTRRCRGDHAFGSTSFVPLCRFCSRRACACRLRLTSRSAAHSTSGLNRAARSPPRACSRPSPDPPSGWRISPPGIWIRRSRSIAGPFRRCLSRHGWPDAAGRLWKDTWQGQIDTEFAVTADALDALARAFEVTGATFAGSALLEGSLQGESRSPRALGHLTAQHLSIDNTPIGALNATFDLAGRQLNIDARAIDLNVQLQGDLDTREPFTNRARTAPRSIGKMPNPALLPTSLRDTVAVTDGTVTATVQAQGVLRRPLESAGEVALRSLDVVFSGVPIHLDAPATVSMKPDIITATPVQLRLGRETQVRLQGTGQGRTTAGAAGSPGRHPVRALRVRRAQPSRLAAWHRRLAHQSRCPCGGHPSNAHTRGNGDARSRRASLWRTSAAHKIPRARGTHRAVDHSAVTGCGMAGRDADDRRRHSASNDCAGATLRRQGRKPRAVAHDIPVSLPPSEPTSASRRPATRTTPPGRWPHSWSPRNWRRLPAP